MDFVLFYVTIFISHIIQGITGFAGTLLAMPLSLRLVGGGVAVPVLNGLGLASGSYVFLGNRKSVAWKELGKALAVLIPFMLVGVLFRNLLHGKERILYLILGVIILLLTAKGIYDLFPEKKEKAKKSLPMVVRIGALVLSGIVHGMFVCGGPLLIIYMAECLPEKAKFRATISTVWIFLNGILLVTQIIAGDWSLPLLKTQLIALPVLFLAMLVGSLLYRRMSQRVFMIITYALLFISAVSLFMK